MEITVFVVKDSWGANDCVVTSIDEAIAQALENDALESLEDFADRWLRENCGDDLLDLLAEKNPLDGFKKAYRNSIINSVEDGDCEFIESFEIEIPLDTATITPEIMVAITNIFKCS